jgi:putative flippase GtrA
MILIKSKISRFLYCGAILTLYAFGLNVLLVGWFHLYKPLSYGIVISSQIVIGFLLNRFHVFPKSHFNTGSQFFQYSLAAILFRVSDWVCFTVMVELLSFFYIYAQAFNTATLVVAKYLVYRRIFDAEIQNRGFVGIGSAARKGEI